MLAMKDRLATVAIWTGALSALIPLVAVIAYVIIKGAAVVFAQFPHFLLADMSNLTATSPVTAVGAGAAIVGTLEQVGIATVLTVPLGVLTATYLVNNSNAFSRVVSNVVDAMTGCTGHHCRHLHLPALGGAAEGSRSRRGSLPHWHWRS